MIFTLWLKIFNLHSKKFSVQKKLILINRIYLCKPVKSNTTVSYCKITTDDNNAADCNKSWVINYRLLGCNRYIGSSYLLILIQVTRGYLCPPPSLPLHNPLATN